MDINTLRDNLTAEIVRLRVSHEALSGMKDRGIKTLRNELAVEIDRLEAAINALGTGTPVAVPRRSRRSVAA
jgi:translation initiation factor 6 (eIF-6)